MPKPELKAGEIGVHFFQRYQFLRPQLLKREGGEEDIREDRNPIDTLYS